MKLLKTRITVTPLSKTLALILFITLLFIGFYASYKISHITSSQTYPHSTLQTSHTPNVKIIALNHQGITNLSPNYSFKFPEPQNCSGCYDGLSGAPDGYVSEEIVSWGTPGGVGTTDDWVIQYLTIKDGVSISDGDWFVLNRNFFNQLSKIAIGKTANIYPSNPNISKNPFVFTRENDINISGVPAKVYTSNYVTQYGKRSKYAVFYKDGYTYMLAVEWDNLANSNIFNLLTTSFIFSLRSNSEVIHL